MNRPRLTAARAEHELRKYSHQTLVAVARPALPLRKGERAIDTLPRLTEQTLELKAQYRAVESAAHTFAEVEKKAHTQIDKVADSGAPKTLSMFHGGKIEWPSTEVAKHRVPDAFALLTFIMRDKLKSEVSRLLKANAGAFPDAMSADERAARLDELATEIEAAERIEAAAVEQAVSEGANVSHRPDADILAVLSLPVAALSHSRKARIGQAVEPRIMAIVAPNPS